MFRKHRSWIVTTHISLKFIILPGALTNEKSLLYASFWLKSGIHATFVNLSLKFIAVCLLNLINSVNGHFIDVANGHFIDVAVSPDSSTVAVRQYCGT